MNEVVVKEWALFVGDKMVAIYETKGEAVDAHRWYVGTFGQPTGVLSIRQVSVAS